MLAHILCFYEIPMADHTKEGSYNFKKWSSLLGGLLGGSVGVLSIPKLSGRELTAAAQIPLLLAILLVNSQTKVITTLDTIGLHCVGSDSEREILLSRILPTSVAMLMLILIAVTVLVNVDHKRRHGKKADDPESQVTPSQTSTGANNTAPVQPNSHPSHPATPRSSQAGSQTLAHKPEPNDKTVNAHQAEGQTNDIQPSAERVSGHTDQSDNHSEKEGQETVEMKSEEGNTIATI
ncbi:hypothetical protein FRC07_006450 [Ceratobasidium sp. 392]|nr:hypothetical protein FRC07_006450 [Ceratobasidium sp. 392]